MGDSERLEIKAATSPALLARGCVNIIGLDRFKENAGPRWEKLRETIYARTEAVLSHKLGASDFFVRLHETAYLVTTPASAADDARISCLRVAFELHSSLLGSCTVQDIQIFSTADDGAGGFNIAAVVEPELGMLANRANLKELMPPQAAGETATGSIDAAPAREATAFTHSFLPIWDARKEAISAHRILTRQDRSGATAPARRGAPKEELARLRASITTATRTLAQHLEMGERFLMIVPASYEVLASPVGRMEVAGLCRSLPSEFRQFLIFEIYDVPAGVPQSRLNEIVTIVKPFCKAVMAETPLRGRNYAAYQGIGLSCFGLILPRSDMTVTEIQNEITKLVEAGRRINLMTFVGNVSNPDLLQFARQSGVNLIAGAAVELPSKSPSPMRRLLAADLLRRDSYTAI
jgi:hypothetical protein